MTIALGIIGVSGRVGRIILSKALQDPEIKITGGLASPQSAHKGKDLGSLIGSPPLGISISHSLDDFLTSSDVLIDFSSSHATEDLLQKALILKKPLVIGTTGQNSEIQLLIQQAAEHIPIICSANFSLGMAACFQAAALLSKMLKQTFTIHIEETHHIHKKDCPSGTALTLAQYMGTSGNIHSLRKGEVLGEHRVIFKNEHESVELRHEVFSRSTFAEGALFAAKALVLKPPGLYSLKDFFT